MEHTSGKQEYYEEATINGIEISCGFDSDYGKYTLYFPQISPDEESAEQGVTDQVLIISSSPETAKRVFDYAVMIARQGHEIADVYKRALRFVGIAVRQEAASRQEDVTISKERSGVARQASRLMRKSEAAVDKSYEAYEDVKKIEITCRFDPEYNAYTLVVRDGEFTHDPQWLSILEDELPQDTIILQDLQTAKNVFEKAVALARRAKKGDYSSVADKVREYMKQLDRRK